MNLPANARLLSVVDGEIGAASQALEEVAVLSKEGRKGFAWKNGVGLSVGCIWYLMSIYPRRKMSSHPHSSKNLSLHVYGILRKENKFWL